MSYYDWARLGHCFNLFDGSTSPSIHSSSRSSSNLPPVDDIIPYTDPKDRAKAAAPKGKGLI